MSRRIVAELKQTDLALYTRVAHVGAAHVIREYSTSFGMATRLLGRHVRPHIENIYALVRVADEIVDGAARQAGLDSDAQRDLLDALETETERAICSGYSANVIVHSFAATARGAGFGRELTAPFFASMRRDLESPDFSVSELSDYIYGSAEVVGLMCLRVFLAGFPVTDAERAILEPGARRLGSAFQKVNFLRDVVVDWGELGRCYFADVDPESFTEAQKLAIVTDIDDDLAAAARAIPLLPPTSRRAVRAAYGLFRELNARIRATPAAELVHRRVRVSSTMKLVVVARAWASRSVRGAE
jgi:15-cis-phytoene synthase